MSDAMNRVFFRINEQVYCLLQKDGAHDFALVRVGEEDKIIAEGCWHELLQSIAWLLPPPNPHHSKFELRECATLGTHFADIWCDGRLFAKELSRPVAESFMKTPHMYEGFAEEAKMRTWAIERCDAQVQKFLEEKKQRKKPRKKK